MAPGAMSREMERMIPTAFSVDTYRFQRRHNGQRDHAQQPMVRETMHSSP